MTIASEDLKAIRDAYEEVKSNEVYICNALVDQLGDGSDTDISVLLNAVQRIILTHESASS